MRRRLPPLANIEAFIAAASSPNFKAAADSLALSQAAFSRRIQSLSDHVGVKLFERCGSGARLTEAGRRCLDELEPAYRELIRATNAIGRGARQSQSVHLSTSHALAVGWLIPRLGRFRSEFPEIELSFNIQAEASDLRRGEVDLALCHSGNDLTGFESLPLLDITCTPVAAPEVAQAFHENGGSLAGQSLFASYHASDLWTWWARTSGFADTLTPTTRFIMISVMYEAASQGLGVAMGESPTVWPHIESGRLRPLDLPAVRHPGGYHVATRSDRIRRPPVAKVRRWLIEEAGRTPGFPSISPVTVGQGDAGRDFVSAT